MLTRQIIVARHLAEGERLSPAIFNLVDAEVGDPSDGEIVVDVDYLSIDPYQRGRLAADHIPGFPATFPLGAAMDSYGVGHVVASRAQGFSEGDLVVGTVPWAERAVASVEAGLNAPARLRHVIPGTVEPSYALGAQGLTGMNAYFGIIDIAEIKPGETLVVSGAAGSIGSTAAQIARILGARVIGLAGTEEKCRMLVEELRLAHALDYHSPTFGEELAELCPCGPDAYFDNVGGEVSQTVMWLMRRPARVVECGQISTIDTSGWRVDMFPVHANELTWKAVLGSRHAEFFPAAVGQIGAWIRAKELIPLQTVSRGIDQAPAALAGLFTGANVGKALVKMEN